MISFKVIDICDEMYSLIKHFAFQPDTKVLGTHFKNRIHSSKIVFDVLIPMRIAVLNESYPKMAKSAFEWEQGIERSIL